MLCNTLCLPLHGVVGGIDPTLTDSQRLIMQALARTWCSASCAQPPTETPAGQPVQCPECLYWRRQETETHSISQCLSCLHYRTGTACQGQDHPCKLCEMRWLVIQNPVEQRVALLSRQEHPQPDWEPIQSACTGDLRQPPQWRHSSITHAPGHGTTDGT